METMVAAYVFAWAAVTAYMAWLGVQNRRLCRRLDELDRQTKPVIGQDQASPRAA